MNERERHILEATARGVRALLRQETHKWKQSTRKSIEEMTKAESDLQKALDPGQIESMTTRPVYDMDQGRTIRDKAFNRIISTIGGATCDEICALYNLPHQSVSARIQELATQGLITDSGHTRETRRGRPAIVWMEKEYGNGHEEGTLDEYERGGGRSDHPR